MKDSRGRLVLFCIAFVDMMGFSLQFPLFPKTIQFFLQKEPDAVFDAFFHLAKWLSHGEREAYTFILLGGLLGSSYSLLQFLFGPIWGKLSDSKGRKNILLFTTLGGTFGYILWFFSTEFWMFAFSRVLTGIMGGNLSVAQAAMADFTEPKDRAKGMGMIGAGIGLGFVVGPVLGGFTASLPYLDSWVASGQSVIFPISALFSIGISFLNCILVLVFLPKSPKPVSQGVSAEKTLSKVSHPILMMGSVGVFSPIGILSMLYGLFTFAFSGFEFTLNFFMADVYQYSPKQIGFTFLYIGCIIILVQGGVIRRLSGKVKEKKIALWGSYSVILGLLFLLLHNQPWQLYFCLVFLATGSALLNPSLGSLVSLASPEHTQGASLGMFRSLASLARGLSPIIFSLFYFKQGAFFAFGTSTVFMYLFLYLLLGWKAPDSKIFGKS